MMRTIGVVLLLCLVLPFTVLAQSEAETCAAAVQSAIDSTAANCMDLGANEICFGHADVDTLVNCDEALDFNTPGDRLPLTAICALRIGGWSSEWGIAAMEVESSNGVPMTFVLFGGVEIHNAGSSLNNMQVWVVNETDVYNGPGSHFETLLSLPVGEVITVNACNCTGNWLRLVMDDGRVGWIPAMNATVVGGSNSLPIASLDTPVFEAMQAFTLSSNQDDAPCAEAPPSGMLIQIPADAEPVPLQMNGVQVTLDSSTLFVRSGPRELTLDVLAGTAQATVGDLIMNVPAGARVRIPLSEEHIPEGTLRVEAYTAEEVAVLPVSLLPEAIDPTQSLALEAPQVIGVYECAVVSGTGDTSCPVYFVNYDGDPIVQLETQFVYAAEGEWEGGITEAPTLLTGDYTTGVLSWDVSCNLGSSNFIGPVKWLMTITDEAGHVSEPFTASFDCIDG
ncbi:MAG: hypothetical protein H6672_21720 [Anaerolineaceae bacterium]|nr:hypothetical protein [Anaerolineaceae bacterium]